MKTKKFLKSLTLSSLNFHSAKITFSEDMVHNSTLFNNQCVSLFDISNCQHRFNLLKQQDSVQYIYDGVSLYTVLHKNKEIIIDDSDEAIFNFEKNNPFVASYTKGSWVIYLLVKNKDVNMAFSKENVVLNCFSKKATKVRKNGYYSGKFRSSDLALIEQGCMLSEEDGTYTLHNSKMLSLENKNEQKFTDTNFSANKWLDEYVVIDKRTQKALK